MREPNSVKPEIVAVLQQADQSGQPAWPTLIAAYQECLRSIEDTLRVKRQAHAVKIRLLKAKAKSVGMRIAACEMLEQRRHEEQRLNFFYHEISKKARLECVKLAEAIASEVIGEQIKVSHRGIAKKIQLVLQSCWDSNISKILVGEIYSPHLKQLLDSDRRIELDSKVAEGDAVFLTSNGRIEMSWKKHLEEVCKKLENAVMGM